MLKDRKREGRIQMPRSQKEILKRKQVVKEEPPEVKAFKKYIGDLDVLVAEQQERRNREAA